MTWKSKGKLKFGENENEFTSQATVQGLDHYRSEFNSEFNGNRIQGHRRDQRETRAGGSLAT